jgi:phosphoribosylformimino-5-aminoimidazole carboxamide ribonucleotide (ProFAR) isomerase
MSFRIGASVLLNCNGLAIQSYNFKTKRILGSIHQVLNFLDLYEVDEIHVILPLKNIRSTDSYKSLLDLKEIEISTPIGIGGGITNENIEVITKDPFFERLIFNSAIFKNDSVLKKATSIMGRQSMVAYVPFRIDQNEISVYHAKKNIFISVDKHFWQKLSKTFNEVILLDFFSEGNRVGFDFKVFELIEFPNNRILISGGLLTKDIKIARKMNLAGVSLDNFALHREFLINRLR